MPAGSRRLLAGVAAVVVILGVAFATLLPQPREVGTALLCLVCTEERGLANALANVLLFVPVGAALAPLFGARRAIVLSMLLSLAIETGQLWVPGRHSAIADLLFNSLGGSGGVLLMAVLPRLLRPAPRLARVLAAAWLALAAVATLGGHALLRPAPTDAVWYGQWTPQLGTFESYRGRVLAAHVGGTPLPSWRLDDSARIRSQVGDGAALSAEFVAGPAPGAIAPVVAIGDREQRQILMLAADRTDIVYRVRTRATALGLDSPDFRVRGALAGVSPGDTVRVRVTPASGAGVVRIEVNGRAVDARFSPLDTWALLMWPTIVAREPALHASMNILWLLLLIGPPLAWAVTAARRPRRAA